MHFRHRQTDRRTGVMAKKWPCADDIVRYIGGSRNWLYGDGTSSLSPLP